MTEAIQSLDKKYDRLPLERELSRLKKKIAFGYEVSLKWFPGVTRFLNGKMLAEEVTNDTIFIYTENPEKAIELVRHGFAEWILKHHTKPYRQLINKLISLFEEQQYEKKEKTVEAIMRLFAN